MAEPGRSRRRVGWTAPSDGADHITALPLELRAHIASSLPFRQVARLATLARPWRHIHRHTPVVELELDDFILLREEMLDVLNGDALTSLELALLRRAQGCGSKVDTLMITYDVEDPRMSRHAGLLVALADARRICIRISRLSHSPLDAWSVDLSPAARDLVVTTNHHLAPTVAGPGAAALKELCLHRVELREWPCLPSLRSLTLDDVTIQAPFPPGACCPRLEDLCIFDTIIRRVARVDIRLPLLKRLDMDEMYVSPGTDVAIDAPELEELSLDCTPGYPADYKTFTLRAPRLRCLTWTEQFVERLDIDIGRPGSVTSGRIMFTWSHLFEECRQMKEFRAQMTRMLEKLLPELPPECVAEAARPYMSFDKPTVEHPDFSEPTQVEKITCDLSGLMSSLNVRSPVPF